MHQTTAAPDGTHPGVPGEPVELAYRTAPLVADYFRAGAGLLLAAAPLAATEPAWPVRLGLVALIALFLVFLAQTWQRQRSRVRLAPGGISLVGPAEQRLAWRELDALRLRWFGSRRQGKGWMELELRGGGGQRLVLTSALQRFDDVVAESVQAARDNGLPLEPSTRANVEALLGRAA
jgi:hypothetical protein